MYLHPTTPANQRHPQPQSQPAAKQLSPYQRQDLALKALTHSQPISQLAQELDVSRKFVYQQADKAQNALDDAFDPKVPNDRLLFTLPVTKALLQQMVLGLVLIGHGSLRGVSEFFADLFDYRLSLGTVFNIVHQATAKAQAHNLNQDLSTVGIGAHDEIFQGQKPVLVGMDVHSTYCYLLSQEEHRDEETWGLRLLELVDRGFAPTATVADGGSGLRAGQKLALPGVPCRGDVFHVLRDLGALVRAVESRAYQAITATCKLEQQQVKYEKSKGRKERSVAQRLRHARPAEVQAAALAQDVATLVGWLRQDILSLSGPDQATRRDLYDWVVSEMRAREKGGPARLTEMRKALENQREQLLAFAASLDEEIQALTAQWEVSPQTVREVLALQELSPNEPRRWAWEETLWQRLGKRDEGLRQAVLEVSSRTVRASSVVENLNSRLRNYFFLRRELGRDYLSFLQFYLNHRRFPRSAHAERVGKSPAELLTGKEHAHWLELLGYTRFSQN